jgi:hypothetical protein
MTINYVTYGIIVLNLSLATLVCASEQQQDGITLKVTDYGKEPNAILGYIPNGALIAEKFLAKGIRPVRISLKNDTSKPVMISGRSARLKIINPEEGAQLLHQDNLFGLPAWSHYLGYYVLGAFIGNNSIDIFIDIYGIRVFSAVGYIFLFKSRSHLINKEEVLVKFFKDLSEEDLRYPEIIQPGKKATKLLLLDERIHKKSEFDFFVFDEKHEESLTKFTIELG